MTPERVIEHEVANDLGIPHERVRGAVATFLQRPHDWRETMTLEDRAIAYAAYRLVKSDSAFALARASRMRWKARGEAAGWTP